ncbi:hypothetical protein O3P69_003078 [Scylla paramamosain]|uniref:Uncharacterized protein n=1 Tax=Scylla paramamosain TaxID=85552 RepID=A0AAW0UJ07_SCYPA
MVCRQRKGVHAKRSRKELRNGQEGRQTEVRGGIQLRRTERWYGSSSSVSPTTYFPDSRMTASVKQKDTD